MTEREFVHAFVQQKERFIRQLTPGAGNIKALDLFENWLKGNLPEYTPRSRKQLMNSSRISTLLDQTVAEAAKILAERGIRVNCVSLPVPISKSSSRCLRVQNYHHVYYRIRKTSPRKGKYKGEHLISIELVADGNKNNVFTPLLNYKESMELELNRPIERENKTTEATGKYRLKIVFNGLDREEHLNVQRFGSILADFVSITAHYLELIGHQEKNRQSKTVNESIRPSP